MQRRAARLILVALLVAAALAAAYVTWDSHSRSSSAVALANEVDARLDRMTAAVAALGAAQQAYVAPGQQRGDALTRATVLVQQIYDDVGALRRVIRSDEAAPAVLAFGAAMDELVNVDDRAREHLRLEQELMAADLVYTEARQALDALAAPVETIRTAERRHADAERAAVFAREASTAGAVALVSLVALLVLARVPRDARTGAALAPATETVPAVADAPLRAPERREGDRAHDLKGVAAVCTDLARLAGPAALPVALARAARVIDAAGIVVWLGAGEELFPAVGHGYSPAILARLGPISRADDNPTATAWRAAELVVVHADPGRHGAIVAPLFGPSGCFGVLATEVKNGRERDETTQTAVVLIAAQLSTVVAPWPAASDGPGAPAAAPEQASSERTAASA
jgi:hypothetical protein